MEITLQDVIQKLHLIFQEAQFDLSIEDIMEAAAPDPDNPSLAQIRQNLRWFIIYATVYHNPGHLPISLVCDLLRDVMDDLDHVIA